MSASIIELFSLAFQLLVLAGFLGVVGFAVNKYITRVQLSRMNAEVNSAAALARARAHARAARA